MALRLLTGLFLAGWATTSVLAAQPDAERRPVPEPLRKLVAHSGVVRAVSFSPDGKTLASGSFDKTAKLWDVASGQEQATLRGHGEAHVAGSYRTPGINSLAFTADGKILATAGLDGTVKLWDVTARKELRTLRGHSNRVLSIAISPDSKTLASASEDRSLRIWEIASGRQQSILFGHSSGIEAVTFDADGKTLVSGATDGTIKLWDPAEGRQTANLRMWKEVVSVATSPDGKSLAAGLGSGALTSWYLGDNVERRVLEGHRGPVFAVAFSPDSKTLASASLDGTVRLWDMATGRRLASVNAHEKGAWALAFSPDGKLLATGGEDRAIKLWDVAKLRESTTGETARQIVEEPPRPPQPQPGETAAIAEIKRLGGRFVGKGWRATFSPDGNRIAFGKIIPSSPEAFPALAVVDLKIGRTTELAKMGKDPAWSPGDGKYIAYTAGGNGGDEEIWLIESSGTKPRRIAKGGFAAWSRDGKVLFFHSHEKNKLMSTDPFGDDPAGQAKELMDVGSWYPAISGVSKQVAFGSGSQLVVASWEGGKAARTWPLQQSGTLVPGWSPDGRQLGITGNDQRNLPTFWILNVESGRALRAVAAPVGIPAWSPDGSKLAFDLRVNFPLVSEVWMIETKVLEGLKPEELPRDRYTLPEGGKEDLVKFIEELRRFRPTTPQESAEYANRGAAALQKAAERILQLERNRTSEAWQIATLVLLESRVRTAARGTPEGQRQTVADWRALLDVTAGKKHARNALSLGMMLGQALEQGTNPQLAADVYKSCAEVMVKSEDRGLSATAKMMEGAARRLSLVGKPIELKGTKLDGSPLDWAAYRGKVVLIDFWTSWCPWCWPEIAAAKKNYALYHDRGFEVIGVNLEEDRQKVEASVAKEQLPWAVLYNEGTGWRHPMAVHYGISSVPTMFLVDREGKVVSLKPRGQEMDRLLDRLLGPPYRPQGNLNLVDLQPKGNRSVTVGESDNPLNNLKALRRGEQTLAGVRFRIGESLMQLGSRRRPDRPQKIEGIVVNKAAANIYFLHATEFGSESFGVRDGTKIGEYAVRYDDGSQQSIPIVCGEDVRDWWNNDGGRAVKRGRVGWFGTNDAARGVSDALRLYVGHWHNPYPGKKIASIDFISARTDAAPFCVAMTVEEPASAEAPPASSSPTPKR